MGVIPKILLPVLAFRARRRLTKATPYYDRADAHYRKSELGLAIEEISKALLIDPDNPRGKNQRGGYYSIQGDYRSALADFDAVIGMDPDIRGLVYGNTHWLRRHEDLALTHDGRGIIYAQEGAHTLAIAEFSTAIEVDSYCVSAYVNRGDSYVTRGEHSLAISDYSNAISASGAYDAYVYNKRSLAYQAINQHDMAIADSSKAIEIDPQDFEAYENRQRSFEAKGQYQLAADDVETVNRLLDLYGSDERTLEDLDDDDLDLLRRQDETTRHHDRAMYYFGKEEHDLAIAEYGKAISVDPTDGTGYNNRGLVYLAQGEYDRAIADFNTAIGFNQGIWVAYENRDKAYIAKGDGPAATET